MPQCKQETGPLQSLECAFTSRSDRMTVAVGFSARNERSQSLRRGAAPENVMRPQFEIRASSRRLLRLKKPAFTQQSIILAADRHHARKDEFHETPFSREIRDLWNSSFRPHGNNLSSIPGFALT